MLPVQAEIYCCCTVFGFKKPIANSWKKKDAKVWLVRFPVKNPEDVEFLV
jgi:hypothetical protein